MNHHAKPLLVLLALLVTAGSAAGQESASGSTLLPVPPAEIDSLLGLLDAIEAAEAAVLSGRELTGSEIDELRELTAVADTFVAEDLGARARSLLFLVETESAAVQPQPALDDPLQPTSGSRLVRGSPEFETFATLLGATGGSALALSAVFYVLAERDYQRWRNETDSATGDELFLAWRSYDILSLSMGGLALLAGGVGVPLLYGLAAEPTFAADPLGRAAYTEDERAAVLAELYAERAELVTRLNLVNERQPARDLVSTIGLASGLVGSVSAFTFFYLAEETFQEYIRSPFTDEAEALGRRIRLFDALAITSATVAAAGFGTTIGIDVFTLNRQELEEELRRINREIVNVRTAPVALVPVVATDASE